MFTVACQNLGKQAEKALVPVKRMICRFENLNVHTEFDSFDKKIQPILMYGSEIWGTVERKHIEVIHKKL